MSPVPGETILVACSGGRDSVALAALASAAAARSGATVVLGHVNHAVRERSWQDEAVALAAGALLGVRVVTTSLGPGPAAEARLRDERYAALATMARAVGARRIATAHHARDQAETILLALLRGTGPDGLAGMPATRELTPGVCLVRPVLEVEPDALVAYCAARRLPYAIDWSNADLGYRRNALRAAPAAPRSCARSAPERRGRNSARNCGRRSVRAASERATCPSPGSTPRRGRWNAVRPDAISCDAASK